MVIFRTNNYIDGIQILVEGVFSELSGEVHSPEKRLYKKAYNLWGSEAQTDMVFEELAELMVKVNHLKRGRIRPFDLCFILLFFFK